MMKILSSSAKILVLLLFLQHSNAQAGFFDLKGMDKWQKGVQEAWNYLRSTVDKLFVSPESKESTVHKTTKDIIETKDAILTKKIEHSSSTSAPSAAAPTVSTKHNADRKALVFEKAPQYKLNPHDHDRLLKFSQNARKMPEPVHEFSTQVRASSIQEKFVQALKKESFKNIRSPQKLLSVTVKISKNNPDEISFVLLDTRLNALLSLWEGATLQGVTNLWAIAQQKENPALYQARDALFTAYGALQIDQKQTALMALEYSLRKKIEEQDRYLLLLSRFINTLPTAYTEILTSQALGNNWEKIPLDRSNKQSIFQYAKNHLKLSLKNLGDSRESEKIKILQAIQLIREKKLTDAEVSLDGLAKNSLFDDVQVEAKQNLARLYSIQGKQEEAVHLYKSVTLNAKNKADLLLEIAYAEFKMANHAASLGKTIGLQSPYFLYAFQPDTPILEALNKKALCDFGGASSALKNFQSIYSEEKNRLETYSIKTAIPGSLYRKLINSISNPSESSRFERYAIHLPILLHIQSTMNDREKEKQSWQKIIKSNTKEETQFFVDVQNFQNTFHERQMIKFEKILKQEIADALDHIQKNSEQAALINLDISSKASSNHSLESAMNYPKPQKPEATSISYLQKVRWPYEDEIWEDEIPYLTTTNANKCIERKVAGIP